jgi:hypothetical protein
VALLRDPSEGGEKLGLAPVPRILNKLLLLDVHSSLSIVRACQTYRTIDFTLG